MIAGVVVWASCSSLLSVLGCPACAAVLWKFFKRHQRGKSWTPNDVFMLNITIMDVFFLSFIPLGLINFLLWRDQRLQTWTDFLYDLNLTGRPLLTACMCLDSYVAVLHPVFYRSHRSPRVRIPMAAAAWSVTVAKGTVSSLVAELNHGPWTMAVYVIALPLIIFCNSSVLWKLRKSASGRTDLHPMKKKALQIVTNSSIVSVAAYFPPVVVFIFGPLIFSQDQMFECYLVIPLLVSPTAGSAITPLLYLSNLRGLC